MRALCGCWAADPDKMGAPCEVVAEQCAFPALHESVETLATRLEGAAPDQFPNAQNPVLLSEFARAIAAELRKALAAPIPSGPFRPCMVIGCAQPRSSLLHNPPYGGPDNHHVYVQGPMPGEGSGP